MKDHLEDVLILIVLLTILAAVLYLLLNGADAVRHLFAR